MMPKRRSYPGIPSTRALISHTSANSKGGVRRSKVFLRRSRLPQKLILSNGQSPGDIVMLTVAIRDLHRQYPGMFLTDVRTPFPDLWMHNPYLNPIQDDDPEAELIVCEYPLIHTSNQRPYHFVHSFVHFLGQRLGLPLEPTDFKGDIHLSPEEREWFHEVSQKHQSAYARPFWLIVSGGKMDFTIKWWDYQRYQEVVDHFRGQIEFVQIGERHHQHPPLSGVVDLRGQTSIRHLIRLMYHAQGVVTPVSFPMHLAAAVESRPDRFPLRPCVVIAGGREPSHWAAYPHHQFIHTTGQLPCCANGGCWRSRTVPLGDGAIYDTPQHLCLNVVNKRLPRCMDMISSQEVIRRISSYFEGGCVIHH